VSETKERLCHAKKQTSVLEEEAYSDWERKGDAAVLWRAKGVKYSPGD